MARVSRDQTAKNHERIEQASARLLRERGLDVSVADVMADAGLTHGGFYGHFASKDELAAAACARAFGEAAERWRERTAGRRTRRSRWLAVIESYLSAPHRDHPGAGCAATALAADVARQPPGKPVRAAYVAGCKQLAAMLADLSPAATPAGRARQGWAQLAMLVGAVSLSRAMDGDPDADQVLRAARDYLADADASAAAGADNDGAST
ncbi:TetR/AcrR family transcriptional regulator [Pigmentiphaga soli]|uniref:TetR/AcrR family transcriptional regulator n=1 Tax=Pigmentiphaga soli TaxID=1007095 RepID=A0ABP8GJU7_9BURK